MNEANELREVDELLAKMRAKIEQVTSEGGTVPISVEANIRSFEKLRRRRLRQYIEACLSNDEESSDEELVSKFVLNSGCSQRVAEKWLSHRAEYLNGIVPSGSLEL